MSAELASTNEEHLARLREVFVDVLTTTAEHGKGPAEQADAVMVYVRIALWAVERERDRISANAIAVYELLKTTVAEVNDAHLRCVVDRGRDAETIQQLADRWKAEGSAHGDELLAAFDVTRAPVDAPVEEHPADAPIPAGGGRP